MTSGFPQPGEPAPWFVAHAPINPRFRFDTVAGRYVVLCFFGAASDPASRQILDDVYRCRDRFDDEQFSFFGVSIDPSDEQLGRVREELPGIHLFWDFDGNVSRLFRAVGPEWAGQLGEVDYCRFSLILDERLRVLTAVPFDDPAAHVPRLLELLSSLPALAPSAAAATPAPVLLVPRIFEPELCRTLIRYYDEHGGEESGFVREVDGQTVQVHDYGHKRRRDQEISDEPLRKACMVRVHDRLAPEILKAFQFRATRIERYIVACYEASTGGHFRPHRDNTTKGTAHRRFAVSLNLNTGEYEGGDLRFPEFGRQTYTPPAGGAVVFSCSLLHEATPVTAGKRYAFLPFLYDDAAAKIREENLRFVQGAS
jgi:predicted 2-oxoglutarate/Fe(II)-dependent dioxygenase YbiX/peroxiredoxin